MTKMKNDDKTIKAPGRSERLLYSYIY